MKTSVTDPPHIAAVSPPDMPGVNAYLAERNATPKPFVRTKSAEAILAKLDRLPVTSL